MLKKVDNEEISRSISKALSRMEKYEIFNYKIVKELRRIYERNDWIFLGNSVYFPYLDKQDFPYVATSQDYSLVKKIIIPKVKNKKEMAYVSAFKAYLACSDILLIKNIKERWNNFIKDQYKFPEEINLPGILRKERMVNETISELKKKIASNSKPQSLYLADLTLREDEEELKKFRSKFFIEYYPFLICEEEEGIRNTFNRALFSSSLKYNLKTSLEFIKFSNKLFPSLFLIGSAIIAWKIYSNQFDSVLGILCGEIGAASIIKIYEKKKFEDILMKIGREVPGKTDFRSYII